MIYLRNMDKIFCIECSKSDRMTLRENYNNQLTKDKERKCRLFDLNEKRWEKLSSFKYIGYDHVFKCILC